MPATPGAGSISGRRMHAGEGNGQRLGPGPALGTGRLQAGRQSSWSTPIQCKITPRLSSRSMTEMYAGGNSRKYEGGSHPTISASSLTGPGRVPVLWGVTTAILSGGTKSAWVVVD